MTRNKINRIHCIVCWKREEKKIAYDIETRQVWPTRYDILFFSMNCLRLVFFSPSDDEDICVVVENEFSCELFGVVDMPSGD